MNVDIAKILAAQGNTAIKQLRENLASTGTNATGRTSRSLRLEVDESSSNFTLTIAGRDYFRTVETGRKPTPKYDKPSREFVKTIKEWADTKGIGKFAYAIARSIHQKGTELFRKGGREDIIKPVGNTLLENIANDILDKYSDMFLKNAVDILKNK